ncbi:MAG: 2-octaprenyl-6-methoxyphenyl hydroxylase [Pseudohaliea sp.]
MSRRIVIAGGGMVGISLALALARQLPEAVELVLVEGFPLPEGGAGTYHPSFDARSTALSYSTRRVFETLDAWGPLAPGACPIEHIHVSSRGHFGSSRLHSAEQGWPALGWVVENAWLGRVLAERLRATPRVRVLSPARCLGARPDGGGLRVSLESEGESELAADLLVIADGARSGLRDALGLGATEKRYGQDALVANVAFAEDPAGRAFERFTASGPLALLPLLPAEGTHRAALVWTLPPARAADLLAAPAGAFLAALRDAFGYRLGRPLAVGERHSYPLALVEARETVRRHVVVVGNAAHALHPVAGQGFNLALRDVHALADEIARGVAAGAGPGDLAVLEAYRDRQAGDQQRTIAASDLLPGLFMQADPLIGIARDFALAGLDVARTLKDSFVRHAAGMAALETPRG